MAEYIEREALIKRFKELGLREHSFMERAFADGVYCILENFPSTNITPVVHGKWEPIINSYGELEGWIHNKCGVEVKQAYKYCPECGALMEVEKPIE